MAGTDSTGNYRVPAANNLFSVVDRINMEADDIEAMIRSAALEELRAETPSYDRERSLSRAATALDALCALSEREGPGSVWDVLRELDRAELLAFSSFAISEMADHTQYRWIDHEGERPSGDEDAVEPAAVRESSEDEPRSAN